MINSISRSPNATAINRSYDSPLPFTEISERYDELMDAPVRLIDGTITSCLTLADRAYQHEYFGQQLKKQLPRFGFMFDDTDRVIEYLGADADIVGHMYELAYHAAALLRAHPEIILSDDERGLLMFTLLGHDMDEPMHEQIRHSCGGVTGDIPAGQKTDEDRFLQTKIRQFRDTLLYQDVPRSTLERVEQIVSHQDTTILGVIYRAAHELQSYETTKNAEATLASGLFRPADKNAIEQVAFNVREVVVEKLTPHIGAFAYISVILEQEPAA
jgi:hypothetical protein